MRNRNTSHSENVQKAFLIFCAMAIAYFIAGCTANLYFNNAYPIRLPPTSAQYAEVVTTNLVRVPCACGFCRPAEGIVVPEHINQIGYDLKVVVSTSYCPVVSISTH